MRPQSCKAKGRRLQQKIVEDILTAFPSLKQDDVFSTSMGCGGEDVKMSPATRNLLPLSIEAKNQEKLNVWDAYSQAESNCPANITPCVIFKKNNTKTFAMIPWDKLLSLYVEISKNTSLGKRKRMKEIVEELKNIIGEDYEDNYTLTNEPLQQ